MGTNEEYGETCPQHSSTRGVLGVVVRGRGSHGTDSPVSSKLFGDSMNNRIVSPPKAMCLRERLDSVNDLTNNADTVWDLQPDP